MGEFDEQEHPDPLPDAPDRELLEKTLADYMAKTGMRHTEQRRVIVQTLLAAHGHFTVDEVLASVREKNSAIGYATVYRTLKLLTQSGVASERHFGDGSTRYEITLLGKHHDHLICEECGHIIEFDEPLIEQLQLRVAESAGFELTRQRLELYGACGDTSACQERKLRRQRRS